MTDDGRSVTVACADETKTWRHVQDRFLARSRQTIDRARHDGSWMPVEELLRRMDDRIDAARERLAVREQDC